VARTGIRVTLDREAVHPVLREDAQVDVVGQHHCGMPAALVVVVAPDFLMHGRGVAGQRHHLAQGRKARHQPVGIGADPGDAQPDMGGLQLGLGQAKLCRQVAFAQGGFGQAGGANGFGIGHAGNSPSSWENGWHVREAGSAGTQRFAVKAILDKISRTIYSPQVESDP
jgi:hypothetical protein